MAAKHNQLKRRTEQLLQAVAEQEARKPDSNRIIELLNPVALEGLEPAEMVRRYQEAMRISQGRR